MPLKADTVIPGEGGIKTATHPSYLPSESVFAVFHKNPPG